MNVIADYRKRNKYTQSQVANRLHVDASYISRVEKGEREITSMMYQSAFNNVEDAVLLNDMAYQFTNGYTAPTASDSVYDNHRLSIIHRLKREIKEFITVADNHSLDKHQDHLTIDEKEGISDIISELQDVVFESQTFINKLIADYDFITSKEIKQKRDARLKMQRRI